MGVFAATRWPGLMPDNFSAAYALAFCAGAFFPGKLAWALPLGALVLTDAILNCFYYAPRGAKLGSLSVILAWFAPNYIAYVFSIWLGRRFTAKASWLRLLSGGLVGAIFFYVVSNTGAWLQNPEYAKNLAGWIQALTVGTPGWPHTWEFFRNTLMSGGLFTGLFAGAMKAAEALEPDSASDEEPVAEPEETEPEESPA
jgi:hypothetical protein